MMEEKETGSSWSRLASLPGKLPSPSPPSSLHFPPSSLPCIILALSALLSSLHHPCTFHPPLFLASSLHFPPSSLPDLSAHHLVPPLLNTSSTTSSSSSSTKVST